MRKKVLIKCLLIMLIFCLCTKVKAEEAKLKLIKIPDVYYTRTGGSLPYKSSQFSVYSMNNRIVYCIEADKNITTYDYIIDENFKSPYSKEITEKIMLIGYYGYEYPGHQTTVYSMATQALIWELVSDQKVKFWTERYGEGDLISVEKQKKEIMNLVNAHDRKPSFYNQELNGHLKQEIILKDLNNVIENYEIVDDGGNIVSINENSLSIVPKVFGSSKITLARKNYDDITTVVYKGQNKNNSQKLAVLRASQESSQFTIFLNTMGIKLKVQKVEKTTNEVINLAGIKFQIKDLKTEEYLCYQENEKEKCYFETDLNGSFLTPMPLYGTYQLEEVIDQEIEGYHINKTQVVFTINEDSIFHYDETIGNYFVYNFPNEKIVFEVPKTGRNDQKMMGITFIGTFLLGSGFLYYGKKKFV